jgi:hypothetical protein
MVSTEIVMTAMRLTAGMVALCLAMSAAGAQPQTAEERYLAARDAAIERFSPERVPNVGPGELEAEGKARGELDNLIRGVLGPIAPPPGFDVPAFNVTTLFSGDIDFGKLDGLVFEADGGDTRLVVTTRSLLTKWLQAKWQDPKDRLAPEAAMKSETFYLRALGSDAAILRYADIAVGIPEAFAILAARTQDMPPLEADEVFVTAIRGDRVLVASARIAPPLSVAACTKPREAAEAKLAQVERAEIKPGPRNAAALERVIRMREQIEADFRACFAERAPKEAGFANAVRGARELLDRVTAK